jgi:hypothetical protein
MTQKEIKEAMDEAMANIAATILMLDGMAKNGISDVVRPLGTLRAAAAQINPQASAQLSASTSTPATKPPRIGVAKKTPESSLNKIVSAVKKNAVAVEENASSAEEKQAAPALSEEELAIVETPPEKLANKGKTWLVDRMKTLEIPEGEAKNNLERAASIISFLKGKIKEENADA